MNFPCFSCANSINRLSKQNVRELMSIIKQNGVKITQTAEEIADKYNAKVLFSPGNVKLIDFSYVLMQILSNNIVFIHLHQISMIR